MAAASQKVTKKLNAAATGSEAVSERVSERTLEIDNENWPSDSSDLENPSSTTPNNPFMAFQTPSRESPESKVPIAAPIRTEPFPLHAVSLSCILVGLEATETGESDKRSKKEA